MAARRGGAGVSGAVMGWFVDSHDFSLRASPPRHDWVTNILVQGPGDCSGRAYIQVPVPRLGSVISAQADTFNTKTRRNPKVCCLAAPRYRVVTSTSTMV